MKIIKKTSTVQQVADSLIDYIKGGDVAVGDKLPTEMSLCSQLGVGRGTIREAIRLLQASGYVDLRPSRGAFVASKTEIERAGITNWFQMNSVELQSITEIRSALEPLATKLAIENCTEEALVCLKDIQAASAAAAHEGNFEALGALDEQFHSKIAELSGNQLLIQFNLLIAEQLKNFRSRTFNIPKNVANFIPAHADIIAAFEARDPELGERRMKSHMKKVAKDLMNSK